MSTEENEELVLVHEDYIDEQGIDESEFPQDIIDSISDIDALIDQYNEMDEEDEQISVIEEKINNSSKVIKASIISWERMKPSAPPTPPIDNPAPPKEGEEPIEGKEKAKEGSEPPIEKKKEEKKEKGGYDDFFWMQQ